MNWSIELGKSTPEINSVWVTTNSIEIGNISKLAGARIIDRPEEISGDQADSESAWIHAIESIENLEGKVDLVVVMQATSPLRLVNDLSNGINFFISNNYDSLFSATKIDDLYFWEKNTDGCFESINYDWKARKRRQEFSPQFVENGSFYIFKPEIIRKNKNRLGGKIGIFKMNFWQMFEIDSNEDLNFCKLLMKHYVLEEN